MARVYVNDLTHQDTVDEVYLASDKQLRPNRNGNLYLQVQLSDRTGSIGARMWNANEAIYNSFKDGDFIHIRGTTQLYQGGLQLIATHVDSVPRDEVDPDDFQLVSPRKLDELVGRMSEMLRSIDNPHLASLAECFLIDEDFMGRFGRAPAGVKHHHAYAGGLLEHVVNLMEVVTRIVDLYPAVDSDLLLMGAFLHDSGKIVELSSDQGLIYTDEGQLIGHLVIGVELLNDKIGEAERLSGESFPAETALRLKHMIVSHHGCLEHGSPRVPMTLEAIALHYLDDLDAKLHQFEQQIREDPNVDSVWTHFNQALGRKLFKGKEQRREPSAATSRQ